MDRNAQAVTTTFRAHSSSKGGHEDPVREHLQDVAERAAAYAAPFRASEEARMAGLLHDVGKYGDLFERRLEGAERGIDHWSAGAWVALSKYHHAGIASALAIEGHHVGLQQASKDSLSALQPDRLTRQHPLGLRLSEPSVGLLLERFRLDDLVLPESAQVGRSICEGLEAPAAAAMLDVRMLYSTLVDADFVETEAHFRSDASGPKRYRETGPRLEAERDLSVLLTYLEHLTARSDASAAVTRMRTDLLEACLEAATGPPGLYTVTAPTGTGKTLSLLAFALKHAHCHGLRRVVAVIPFLSIIEQTAIEYRKALAKYPVAYLDRYVREYHSLAGTRFSGSRSDRGSEDGEPRVDEYVADCWDSPVVITTSVQLMESLLANRPSACRKLHRLAQSIIILDEVQNLPAPLAVPTLATLSRLSQSFGATIVLSTATQPAFAHFDAHVRKYSAAGWRAQEMVPARLDLFARARRVEVEWPADPDCRTSWSEVSDEMAGAHQALCVVNLKRHAAQVYDALEQSGIEGLLHLSTSMCPAHRQAALTEVRRRLADGLPCRLVSTQCIEAGVDVDFPLVLRAWGPLDAIAQAAGRCNRNGREAVGRVRVFTPEDEEYPDGGYRQAASVTRILWRELGGIDINDPVCFERYFHMLYDLLRPQTQRRDLLEAVELRDFREVARLYRLIPKDAINILVSYDHVAFAGLREEVAKNGLVHEWIQAARSHLVNLYRPGPSDGVRAYLDPIPVGRKRWSEDWFIYLAPDHYHPGKGLVVPSNSDCLIA